VKGPVKNSRTNQSRNADITSSVISTMLNLSNRMRGLARSLAKGMATIAPRIGDTKVPMSLLERGAYINYQRIEDNLAIVRER
jgi:hypothetical protein